MDYIVTSMLYTNNSFISVGQIVFIATIVHKPSLTMSQY